MARVKEATTAIFTQVIQQFSANLAPQNKLGSPCDSSLLLVNSRRGSRNLLVFHLSQIGIPCSRAGPGAGSGDEIRLFLRYHNCRCVGEPGDLQESFIWAVRAYGHRFFKRESALALPLAASDAVRGRYVRPPLGLLDRQEPRCTDGVSVCTTVNGFRSAAEVAVALLSPNFERGKSAPSGSAMEWLLDDGESENDEWCRGRHATRSQ